MRRCISALVASMALALAGGVGNAAAQDLTGGVTGADPAAVVDPASVAQQPVEAVTTQATEPAAVAPEATEQASAPTAAPASTTEQPAAAAAPVAPQENIYEEPQPIPEHGQSQTNDSGQTNDADQISVPVASPATQVVALNNVQAATIGSENGDVESNNQSQEFEQSNEQSGGSSEKKGSDNVSGRSGGDCINSCNSSAGQSNDADQALVPIGSPATQVAG